jgi:hypothetical protein
MISDLADDELRQAYQDWIKGDDTYTIDQIQDEYKERKLIKKIKGDK